MTNVKNIIGKAVVVTAAVNNLRPSSARSFTLTKATLFRRFLGKGLYAMSSFKQHMDLWIANFFEFKLASEVLSPQLFAKLFAFHSHLIVLCALLSLQLFANLLACFSVAVSLSVLCARPFPC